MTIKMSFNEWINGSVCVQCVQQYVLHNLKSFIQCACNVNSFLCEQCWQWVFCFFFCLQRHVVTCMWHQITNSHFSLMVFFSSSFASIHYPYHTEILSKFSSLLKFTFGFSYHDIIIFSVFAFVSANTFNVKEEHFIFIYV